MLKINIVSFHVERNAAVSGMEDDEKGLLLIHSPVSGDIIITFTPLPCALISDPHPNPNPNPNQCFESYHNPYPIPNLYPTKR